MFLDACIVYRIQIIGHSHIKLRWNDHELYPTEYVFIRRMSVTIRKINNNNNSLFKTMRSEKVGLGSYTCTFSIFLSWDHAGYKWQI